VILGTAVSARAACIVTGDADLLVLGEFRGVAIVSPRAFLTLGAGRFEEE
jgi:predicted nucleic acid-binding protein